MDSKRLYLRYEPPRLPADRTALDRLTSRTVTVTVRQGYEEGTRKYEIIVRYHYRSYLSLNCIFLMEH